MLQIKKLFIWILTGAATLASAGPIQVLKDINQTVKLGPTSQKPAAVSGGWVLSLCTDHVGCEPWFTDGTSAGTRMIKDLTPPGLSWASEPRNFVVLGNTAYFSARQANAGLWKTDGTANGTVWVSDYSADSQPIVVGSAMYFLHGDQLVKSDGTTAGTVVLANQVQTGTGEPLAAAGPYVLFSRYDGTDIELWRTDGTVAGTQLLFDTVPGSQRGSPMNFRSTGDRAYFTVTNGFDSELWSSNGTAAGTNRIVVNGENGVSAVFNGRFFYEDGAGVIYSSLGTAATTVGYFGVGGLVGTTSNAIYFAHPANGSTTVELWKSADGVAPPTLVAALPQYRSPDSFVAVGSVLYFRLPGTGGGPDEVWKTDGTGAGTVFVSADFYGPAIAVGNTLIGWTPDAAWRSDGTGAGTTTLAPPAGQPNNDSQCASGRINFAGQAYFPANDGIHGCELWRTDGTEAGTTIFKDVQPGSQGLFADDDKVNFTIVGSTLFFTSNGGGKLWKTDGTPDGTVLVKEFSSATVKQTAAAGSTLLLSLSSLELWQSDGTDAGTVLLKDGFSFEVGSETPGPHDFVASGPYVYFSARSISSTVSEVWRTDLTTAGTVMLQRFNGAGSAFSKTPFGSGIVFAASWPTSGVNSGVELWKSDGTVAGTVMVRDLNPGSLRGVQNSVTVLGDHVYWYGSDGTQTGLWKSDGTSAGTEFVGALPDTPVGAPAIVVGSQFYYMGLNHLVRSDGTLAGTVNVLDVSYAGSGFYNVESTGSSIYFTASNTSVGNELWRASAVAGESGLVDDFVVGTGGLPGANSLGALQLKALANGLVIATANDVVGSEPFFVPFDANLYSAIVMTDKSISVSEDVGNASIKVERVGDTSAAASATYSTVDLSANAGVQYTATSGTVTWDAGDATPKFILVPVVDNATIGPGVVTSFSVRLDSTSTPPTPLSQTQVDIWDDDSSVQFTSASQTVTEGTASVSFTVARTGTSASMGSVRWQISGDAVEGTDYTGPTEGHLYWDSTDTSSRTIVIPLLDDAVAEAPKQMVVTLDGPTNIKLGSLTTSTATLNDNERGIGFVANAYSVGEGAPSVTLQVKRYGPTNTSASVTWATVNGSALAGQDFGTRGSAVQRSGAISWLAGDTTTKTIVIPILQDTALEGLQSFDVVLSRPSAGYGLVSAQAEVLIVDDELPLQSKVSFVDGKVLALENAGNAVLTVRRTAVGSGFTVPLTVTYATAPGTAMATTDYTTRSGSLTWAASDGADKTISIPIVNNAVAESPKSFKVTLATSSPGARVDTPEAVVAILDDDEVFPLDGAIPDGWTVPVDASSGWHVSNDAGAYEGVFSLRSDPIGDGETAQVEVTRDFAAGAITFRVKVSSEPGFDALRFYIDGVMKGTWSGTAVAGWQLFSVPITAGIHTLRWSYEKDASASMGQDAAWIDAVAMP